MKKKLNENDLINKLVECLKEEKKELNERFENAVIHHDYAKCIEMRGAFTELRRICKELDITFNLDNKLEIEVGI